MVASPLARPSIPVSPLRRVGRYDLLAELGRGGMASVFLARSFGNAGFERLAAVKLLHPALCADPDFVEMFLDEARVAARLHHPNATAITDVGAEGRQLYMVMDYVEGDTLHAVQCAAVKLQRAVPLGIALRVVLDALAGLDAAHELRSADGAPLGLIHRDVTPQNLLIGVDGTARLVDFGIARAAGRLGVTTVGVLKGKLPFMAPEQIRGRAIDRRADVFSMGVTLWETMALRRCFPSREGAMLSRLANEAYRPMADVAPRVPAALDAICRRALAFEPDDRFASAADFAEAIELEFRADLATQRELGQFMTVVAADKLVAEREAARRSAHPLPMRSVTPVARPSTPPRHPPAIDLRAPRVPDFSAAPKTPRAPIDDALTDSEDVTSIAHSSRAPRPAPPPRRPATLPPLPAHALSTRPRPSFTPRPPAREAGALYDVPTQAFTLQRTRPSLAPPPPAPQTEVTANPGSFFPPPDEEAGMISGVRLALKLPTLEPRNESLLLDAPVLSAPPLPVEAASADAPGLEPRPVGLLRRVARWIRARLSARDARV